MSLVIITITYQLSGFFKQFVEWRRISSDRKYWEDEAGGKDNTDDSWTTGDGTLSVHLYADFIQ